MTQSLTPNEPGNLLPGKIYLGTPGHDDTTSGITSLNVPTPNEQAGTHPDRRLKGRGTPLVGAKPRLFKMIRNTDGKEISGTGHVIDGVMFGDGKVVIQWQTGRNSIGIYESLSHFLSIHVKPKYEHENEFIWLDGYKPADDVTEVCDTIINHVAKSRTMKQTDKGGVIALATGIKRKYKEIL